MYTKKLQTLVLAVTLGIVGWARGQILPDAPTLLSVPASSETLQRFGISEWQVIIGATSSVIGIGGAGEIIAQYDAHSLRDVDGRLVQAAATSVGADGGTVIVEVPDFLQSSTLTPEGEATLDAFSHDQLAMDLCDQPGLDPWLEQVRLLGSGVGRAALTCPVSGPDQPMAAWTGQINTSLLCQLERRIPPCDGFPAMLYTITREYHFEPGPAVRSAGTINAMIGAMVYWADAHRPAHYWTIDAMTWGIHIGSCTNGGCYDLRITYRRGCAQTQSSPD